MSRRLAGIVLLQVLLIGILIVLSVYATVQLRALDSTMQAIQGWVRGLSGPNTTTPPPTESPEPTPNPTEFSASITAFWKPR